MTPGKGYKWFKFKNQPPTKFDYHPQSKIFFFFLNVYNEKMFSIEIEDGGEVYSYLIQVLGNHFYFAIPFLKRLQRTETSIVNKI